MARVLEILGDDRRMVATLGPLAAEGGPEVQARLGLAEARLGKVDEAEQSLSGVLGAAEAGAEAKARAHLGSAETLARAPGGLRRARRHRRHPGAGGAHRRD
jgi:hypothetical protein